MPTGPAWSLAESQYSDVETVSSLMPSRQVTLKIGTRHGSTIKTLLRLIRTLCPAFAPCAPLPDKLSPAERQTLAPTINKIKALLGNGLNDIDLVWVWIAWRVIPLSRRPGLMCDYTGQKTDPLRHSPDDLPEDVIDDMTKSLLNKSLSDCGKASLSPFCKANPAPAVNH